MKMQSTGSAVIAFMKTRARRVLGRRQRVEQDVQRQQHQPRPIETRPISLMRERGPLRKATRPMMNRSGATAAILNERICTMSVVPTLAPSMIASASTRPTRPSEADELVIGRSAVLLWRSPVEPSRALKRLFSAFASGEAQIGPERAQEAAVDHVQAPQEQCHATHPDRAEPCFPCAFASEIRSNDQAIAKRRSINPFVQDTCQIQVAPGWPVRGMIIEGVIRAQRRVR